MGIVAYLVPEREETPVYANKLPSGGNRQALTPCCFPVRVTRPPLLLHATDNEISTSILMVGRDCISVVEARVLGPATLEGFVILPWLHSAAKETIAADKYKRPFVEFDALYVRRAYCFMLGSRGVSPAEQHQPALDRIPFTGHGSRSSPLFFHVAQTTICVTNYEKSNSTRRAWFEPLEQTLPLASRKHRYRLYRIVWRVPPEICRRFLGGLRHQMYSARRSQSL